MRLLAPIALVALGLAGCHVDNEVEGQQPDTGSSVEVDASPRPDLTPDMRQPDAVVPDAVVPDAVVPDAVVPDAVVPDAVVPECVEGSVEPCAVAPDCAGERSCTDGRLGECVAPAERCDGADNDCDGTADEGFVGLGEACSAGLGRCARPGVQVCSADGAAVGCDAVAGEPGEETCDGTDEDCDGAVDEAVAAGLPCVTGALGACAAGATVCADGAIACVASAEASAEVCDGLDNDCDGATDEGEAGAPLARDCHEGPAGTADVGVCRSGRQTCAEGVFGACEGQILPEAERCDTLDNDCNGTVDDLAEGTCACQPGEVRACYGGPAGTAGVGICVAGTQTCNADGLGFGPCDGEVRPAAETCDGLDNDCDGEVDNAATAGEACAAGVGACLRPGVRVCDVAVGAVVCDAVAAAPGVETCDGLDNDCNGTVDDVATLGTACTNGVGTCQQAGVRVCDLDAGAVVCDAVAGAPVAEACDGLDNDCDGSLDEGADGGALSRACYDGPAGTSGVARCVAGEQVCVAGAFGACIGQVLPEAERCDGADNDCDGTVDNLAVGACLCEPGSAQACYTGPAGTAAVGICRGGTQVCAADGLSFGPCVGEVLPAAETCDALDNNCNGVVDDVATVGTACNVGVGACFAAGTRVCDVGLGAVVCNAVAGAPAAEICDGIDNDCDGTVDDVANLGAACSNGVGACSRAGTRVCDVASQQLVCNAVAGAPAAEICDGLDNDCNGTVDDVANVGTACTNGVGACSRAGTRVCDVASQQLVCNAVPGAPAAEICDGIDNDCDGAIDNVANVGTACTNGVGACLRAGTRVCDVVNRQLVCNAVPGAPAAEICDGIDNDCNGQADNGNPGGGAGCATGQQGICAAGTTSCSGGGLVCTPNANPVAEVCNGLDDDCDGQVDDVAGVGAACQAGVGACRRAGTQVCDVGAQALVCGAVPGAPSAEVCNGVDDDCDGQVDDGVTRSCYTGPAGTAGVGACRNGTQTCAAGAFGACQGQVLPQDEFCDGADNDCDGQIDDLQPQWTVASYGADRGCVDLAVGDLNGDGRPDVVCAPTLSAAANPDTRMFSYLQQANGTLGAARYTASVPESPFRAQSDVALGDIDGDGDLDMVVVGQTMKVYTYRNNAGNFGAPVLAFDFAVGGEAGTAGLVLQDMNADGRLDIVTQLGTIRDGSGWRLAMSLGNGDGTFQAPTVVDSSGEGVADLYAGDVDGDGDLDIVGFTFTQGLLWRRSGASFGAPVVLFTENAGLGSEGLFADVDGDGRRDLVLPGSGFFLFVRGNGNSFDAPVRTADNATVGAFALTDVDCDPTRELVFMRSNPGNSLRIFPNTPNLAAPYDSVGLSGGRSMATVDFNGDDLDDLIVGTVNATGVQVVIQQP